jgi:hypothetical protein
MEIAYYPIFEDNKTKKVYEEPQSTNFKTYTTH